MSPNTELAQHLEKLMQLEPALAQALENAESLDQAVETALAAAGRHGITLDAAALARLLPAPGTASGNELTDDQLAGVDGGAYYPADWTLAQRLAHERKRRY